MKRLILINAVLLMFGIQAIGQVNCSPPEVTCPCEVVPICGFNCLDNYSLDMTNVPPQGGALPSIPGCGGTIHNPTWFGFVAGATSLTIEIIPNNCDTIFGLQTNSGVQVVLYGLNDPVPMVDCGPNNSNCDPNTLNLDDLACESSCVLGVSNAPIVFNNVPTTPGATYYILIDGCGGSVCNPVDINILSGGDPPMTSGPGPVSNPNIPGFNSTDTICPGATGYPFDLSSVMGAGFYIWEVFDASSTLVSTDETIDPEYTYDFPGGGASYGEDFTICVTPANDCDTFPTAECVTVVIAPLDSIIDSDIILCEGDATTWRGLPVGPYTGLTSNATDYLTTTFNLPAIYNCEVVAAVTVRIENENDESPTPVERIICDGDQVTIFGQSFSGNLIDEIVQGTNGNGCDTFVELDLVSLDAQLSYATTPPIECNAGAWTFTPTSQTFVPALTDPDLTASFEWTRVSDGTVVHTTTGDPSLVLDIDDFTDQFETFNLMVNMVYRGEPMPSGCDFGPFSITVNLAEYIPSDPIIVGPDTVCTGAGYMYFVQESDPIFLDPTSYTWDASGLFGSNILINNPVNGDLIIAFNNPTTGQLCVTVGTQCMDADTCIDIVVIDGADAGPDEVVCGFEFEMQPVVTVSGSEWDVESTPSLTAMATISDVTDPNAMITVNEPGAYTFSYGPGGTCTDEIILTFVDSMMLDGPESVICGNTNTDYTIEFTIIGGLSPYSVISGGGSVTGNIYTSNPILNNDSLTVVIEDDAGCQQEFTFSPFECICYTDAGTMSMDTLSLCGQGCQQAIANFDTLTDDNDVAEFILHTNPGPSAGTIIDRNDTGEFCFIPGSTNFNQFYYISLVVGDDNGTGGVDYSQGCTRVALGQPVIWYEIPFATIPTSNISSCADTISVSAAATAGMVSWSMLDGPGTLTFSDPNNVLTDVTASQCGMYRVVWTADNEGCTDVDTATINFLCNPEVVRFLVPCNLTATGLDIEIILGNGTQPYVEDDGVGTISGDTFRLFNAPLNTADTFNFTDDNGCTLQVLLPATDCSCLSEVGSMSGTLISDCEDMPITATYDPTGANLDGNDSLRFILHTSMDTTLGTIIAQVAGPTISISDGPIICDSTYYLSAVVGNWIGTEVDVNDVCLSVSAGQPIRFDCVVMVDAGRDTGTCETTVILVGNSSSGNGTWSSSDAGVTVTPTAGDAAQLEVTVPGTYELFLTATNGSCTSTDTLVWTVYDAPMIDQTTITEECNVNADAYRISFDITGGTGSYMVVGSHTGTLMAGRFVSEFITTGTSYEFIVFDGNDCARDTIEGVYECPCETMVGDVTISDFDLCEDETVDITALYDDTNENLDGNDVINYILAGDPTDVTNTILIANTSGVFAYSPTDLNFGTTYYLGVIAGTASGPSTVDLSDTCLDVTSLVTVTWYDVLDNFTIDTSGSQITCQDPTVILTLNTLEDTSGYTFQWMASNGGSIVPGTENMPEASVTASGTYTLTISHPIAGCPSSQQVEIGQSDDLPTIMFNMPELLTCDRQEVLISAAGSTSGMNISYSWAGPGIVSGQGTDMIMVNTTGDYTLTLMDASNGCMTSRSINISEDITLPNVSAMATAELNCSTTEVVISGAGSSEGSSISYVWTELSGTAMITGSSTDRDVRVVSPGQYRLEVINTDNGCSDFIDVEVFEETNVLTDFDINLTPLGCAGSSDAIIEIVNVQGGVAPITYSIDGGSTNTQASEFTNLGPGVYDIVVRDANGCEHTDQVILNSPLDFMVDLGPDRTVLLGQTEGIVAMTDLPDSLVGFYQWFADFDTITSTISNITVTPPAGIWTVTAILTDVNGCTSTAEVTLSVRLEKRVYAPNAIHVNSINPENQVFHIFSDPLSVAEIRDLEIFDRWGEKVFERPVIEPSLDVDRSAGWDGTFNDRDAPVGVYVYQFVVVFTNGDEELRSGSFQLLR